MVERYAGQLFNVYLLDPFDIVVQAIQNRCGSSTHILALEGQLAGLGWTGHWACQGAATVWASGLSGNLRMTPRPPSPR